MPRDAFLTAGRAWALCRSGAEDPMRFGAGLTTGLWFVGVDVVRDHLAVNGCETSAWDRWRAAPDAARRVSLAEAGRLDGLAADPEGSILDMDPAWLPAGGPWSGHAPG